MTATTALTAQNTLGVVDIHYTPPDFVRKLIDACITDVGVDVVKTGIITCFRCSSSTILLTGEGMLASAETIRVVAESLQNHHVMTIVVDPVWKSRV
jgi:hydroxymethylpyrimidine/phosphomethylpyrimidine kinase